MEIKKKEYIRTSTKRADTSNETPDQRRIRHNNHIKKYKATPKGYYAFLKKSAKDRGWELMSREEFIEWYSAQEKKCVYCGIPENKLFLMRSLNGKATNLLGVDRIDSSKGYVCGNVCICCITCNRIKTDFFNYQEMLWVGELIHNKWKKAEKVLNSANKDLPY